MLDITKSADLAKLSALIALSSSKIFFPTDFSKSNSMIYPTLVCCNVLCEQSTNKYFALDLKESITFLDESFTSLSKLFFFELPMVLHTCK